MKRYKILTEIRQRDIEKTIYDMCYKDGWETVSVWNCEGIHCPGAGAVSILFSKTDEMSIAKTIAREIADKHLPGVL